jgi:hypothetical protein
VRAHDKAVELLSIGAVTTIKCQERRELLISSL